MSTVMSLAISGRTQRQRERRLGWFAKLRNWLGSSGPSVSYPVCGGDIVAAAVTVWNEREAPGRQSADGQSPILTRNATASIGRF